MKVKILIILFAALTISGCRMFGVRGNGNVVSENRDIESFNKLEAGGAFKILVECGEQTDLRIEAEDNLLKYIRTRVRGSVLEIDTRKNLRPRKNIKIFIKTPDLNGLDLSGASDIKVTGIDNDRFVLDGSGASSIKLYGKTKKLIADISGANHLNAEKLIADVVTIDVSGAGSAYVYAVNEINADVSGAASVKYSGDPVKVRTDVSGAASVRKK